MLSIIRRKEYKTCLDHIEMLWDELTCYHPKDQFIHLGLPNKFIAPSIGIFRKDQFYWDSFFIILGLVKCRRTDLAKGMVDNLYVLFNKFKIVPMRNRYYNIGISQIPFLTSMAMEVFKAGISKQWLFKIIQAAENELKYYWMNPDLTEKHIIHRELSRYCDHYITHLGAEHESGWDMTSRFNNSCLNYLPIDLNTCLFKYETDIAETYRNKDKKKENLYLSKAEKRQKTISQLMWNEKKGFFFDYNYKLKKQSNFFSIAGFYPLWANMATLRQASRVRDCLSIFEHKGGLANTPSKSLSLEFKQHDYPNGWAHQHWIVVKGLLNYGFKEDATRIAKKWLDMNKKVFEKTGKFWEKYNVVKCDFGNSNQDRYPIQSGFGWTNAVFLRLIEELGEK